MEKKTRTIVSDYWELNPADMFVFKELLNYGYHRLTKHNDTGLHGRVNVEEINNLRKQLGIKVKTPQVKKLKLLTDPWQDYNL